MATNDDVLAKLEEHDKWERDIDRVYNTLAELAASAAQIQVSVAVIQEKMKSVDDSVAVLNHNTTSLAERIGLIESRQSSAEEQKKAIKELLTSQRNWTVAVVTIAVSIVTILSLLGILR